MEQSPNWSDDYVKDTHEMLTAVRTMGQFAIIHNVTVNEFFYGLAKKFDSEFEGSLWDLVEKVDKKTAKKIAEKLRDDITQFIYA